MSASVIGASARNEIAQLFARAYLRAMLRTSVEADVHVRFHGAQKCETAVDEIARHEPSRVHANGRDEGG